MPAATKVSFINTIINKKLILSSQKEPVSKQDSAKENKNSSMNELLTKLLVNSLTMSLETKTSGIYLAQLTTTRLISLSLFLLKVEQEPSSLKIS